MATRGVAMSTPGSTARAGRANNDRTRMIAPGMLPLRIGFLTGRSSLFCTGRLTGHFRRADNVPPDSRADNIKRSRGAWPSAEGMGPADVEAEPVFVVARVEV